MSIPPITPDQLVEILKQLPPKDRSSIIILSLNNSTATEIGKILGSCMKHLHTREQESGGPQSLDALTAYAIAVAGIEATKQ